MSTIVLARHGRPAWDHTKPIPGYSLAAWVQGRDDAPLDPSHRPPAALERIANSSSVIAASTLRRSLESAHVLAPGTPADIRPLFREVDLPIGIRCGLRLPPKVWSSFARGAWYCGWSPLVESFAAARARASLAATSLAAIASAQGSVLLVGHALMNGLIGRRLRHAGWSGPWLHTRRFWGFASYERCAG